MNLDDLMQKLYEIYEENNCDGSIPITVSTYACGQISTQPFEENRLEIIHSKTGEVSINFQAEDN